MALSIPMPSFAFYQRLSPRERVLSLLVGGAVFIVANMIVLSVLLGGFRENRKDYADKSQDMRVQEIFAREQPTWAQRMAWLKTKQPPLLNRDRAGTELFDQVQGAARVSAVLLTNPRIVPQAANLAGVKEVGGHDYQAVSVEVDTESDWASLVRFFQVIQQRPENFLVFDLATLRTDPGNAARMKGEFRISKWYAPASK